MMLSRDFIAMMAFWPAFESTKTYLEANGLEDNPVAVSVLSSLVASNIGAICGYPFDLARTLKVSFSKRFQNHSNLQVIQKVFKQKGVIGFLDGKPISLNYRSLAKNIENMHWEYGILRVLLLAQNFR